MKKVSVTYQMTRKIENGRETAETCIVLPMTDEDAEDLLMDGEESAVYLAAIDTLLEALSEIQGYEYVGFCRAGLAGKGTASGGDAPKEPRYRIIWNDIKGNEHEGRYSSLEMALTELRYLEGCPTQGPVRLEEISPDTAK